MKSLSVIKALVVKRPPSVELSSLAGAAAVGPPNVLGEVGVLPLHATSVAVMTVTAANVTKRFMCNPPAGGHATRTPLLTRDGAIPAPAYLGAAHPTIKQGWGRRGRARFYPRPQFSEPTPQVT